MTIPRTRAALAMSAAAVLFLTACDASSAGEGSGNGAGQATSTGPHSAAAPAAPSSTAGIPTPDAAEAATLVDALRAVDPSLATVTDTAVSDAVSACALVLGGTTPADAFARTFPDVTLTSTDVTAVSAALAPFCHRPGASGSPVSS